MLSTSARSVRNLTKQASPQNLIPYAPVFYVEDVYVMF